MIEAEKEALGRRRRVAVQTVERTLDILDVLAARPDGMQLNDIAAATQLNVSTCHHHIAVLLDRAYVRQTPRGLTYFLGTTARKLSRSRAASSLVKAAMPVLRSLNQATGETVSLDTMHDSGLTTLAKLDSRHALRVGLDDAGRAEAAHATGSGKAMLAWLPETMLSPLVSKGLQRFTDTTICSQADLIENLLLVQCDGFAIAREEFQPGVVCVGSAIRDHTGAVIGALCCLLPTLRASEDRVAQVGELVRDAATSLSLQLGEPVPATS
jgi:IclR family acetate operon transcriptional repressor